MDFRVDKRIGLQDALTRLQANSSKFEARSTKKELANQSEDAVRITALKAEASTIGAANQTQIVLDKAAKAASSITDVRAYQLELAERAKATADPEEQARLGAEITTLQTELSRINSEATYNNQSVLGGIASDIEDTSSNVDTSVVLGNYSSLVNNLGISVSNQTNASAAVDTLSAQLLATRKAQSGIEVTANKGDAIKAQGAIETKSADERTAEGLQTLSEIDNLKIQQAKAELATLYPEIDANQATVQNGVIDGSSE